MIKEDVDFIKITEICREISTVLFCIATVFLLCIELEWSGPFTKWLPSTATTIVLALLGIGFRLIAIDRFLRMRRQQDTSKI